MRNISTASSTVPEFAAPLAWSAHLAIGNPVIDDQHKRILALCRRAYDLLRQDEDKRDEFFETINDLADSVIHHFRTEEEILAQNQCPGLSEHAAEHDDYVRKFTEILVNARSGRVELSEMYALLTAWVTDHMLNTDLPAREYLQQRRP